jgi:hypothetical protein
LKHLASPSFWVKYRALPKSVQKLADKNFALLQEDPTHPSLHFKRIDRFFSARVGLSHRVLGVEVDGAVLWFWIGSHAEYDRVVG